MGTVGGIGGGIVMPQNKNSQTEQTDKAALKDAKAAEKTAAKEAREAQTDGAVNTVSAGNSAKIVSTRAENKHGFSQQVSAKNESVFAAQIQQSSNSDETASARLLAEAAIERARSAYLVDTLRDIVISASERFDQSGTNVREADKQPAATQQNVSANPADPFTPNEPKSHLSALN